MLPDFVKLRVLRMKRSIYLVFLATALFSVAVSAQTRKRKKTVSRKAVPVASTSTAAKPEAITQPAQPKKNERPSASSNGIPIWDLEGMPNAATKASEPVYFYEFSRPEFLVAQVFIEHDERGKGKISFMKTGHRELISDPIQLSPATMEKINNALTALDFLNSSENYQYEKDYSHLGNIKVRIKRDGRERMAAFNWTENKDAKILADEYRKIGNQFIWMFDITVARENQPLEAPKLLTSLDLLIRRKEISDPIQMVPFLRRLSDDERIPLIARNHAAKLIKQIEKVKK